MASEVTIYSSQVEAVERHLVPYMPKFAELLPPSLTPKRMVAAAMQQLSNNAYSAKIAMENPMSVAMSIMTGCVLALEIDGVTGQGYLVPFGGMKPAITFMPGYQGYITLADRGAFALDAYPIYSSDEFFETPSNTMQPIHHQVRFVQKSKRGEEIGFYALAKHAAQPPRHLVCDMDEIYRIRDRSQSWKKDKDKSQWGLNFPAMAKKTPIRLLGKRMPLKLLQLAAGVEDISETGRPTYLRSDHEAVVEGQVMDVDNIPQQSAQWEAPQALQLVTPDGELQAGRIAHMWASRLLSFIGRVPAEQLMTFVNMNEEHIKAAETAGHLVQVRAVRDAIKGRQAQVAKDAL